MGHFDGCLNKMICGAPDNSMSLCLSFYPVSSVFGVCMCVSVCVQRCKKKKEKEKKMKEREREEQEEDESERDSPDSIRALSPGPRKMITRPPAGGPLRWKEDGEGERERQQLIFHHTECYWSLVCSDFDHTQTHQTGKCV